MKKIAMLLVLILTFSLFTVHAETPSEEPVLLEGIVTGILEDGYMVYEENLGEVHVLVNEDTYIETVTDIAVGDYIYADYNGQMTRSIPAQITANVLRMYKLEGDIVELMPEDNGVLLDTADYGNVIVLLPEEWAGVEITDTHMTVYFNGAMTMSLPARIGAGYVIPGFSVSGTVTDIADDHIIIGEEMTAIHVNLTDAQLAENLEAGDAVRVMFDGIMTRSIPAQITAISISPIIPEVAQAE